MHKNIKCFIAGLMVIGIFGCVDRDGQLPPPILRIGLHPKPVQQQVPITPPIYTPPPPLVNAYRNVTIVVDPGHGGDQPGTLGKGYTSIPEKAINLLISQELAAQLRSRGANVIMTRTGDWDVGLSERAAKGNAANANLFVSIHIDASPINPHASGSTVYITRGASSSSEQAARRIEELLRRAGIECRGVRRANYVVIRESKGTAVLVECGFLTNYADAKALDTQWHRARIAAAIAQGIARYFGW